MGWTMLHGWTDKYVIQYSWFALVPQASSLLAIDN